MLFFFRLTFFCREALLGKPIAHKRSFSLHHLIGMEQTFDGTILGFSTACFYECDLRPGTTYSIIFPRELYLQPTNLTCISAAQATLTPSRKLAEFSDGFHAWFGRVKRLRLFVEFFCSAGTQTLAMCMIASEAQSGV